MLQEISVSFFCNDNTIGEDEYNRQEEFLRGTMGISYFGKTVDTFQQHMRSTGYFFRRMPLRLVTDGKILNFPLS